MKPILIAMLLASALAYFTEDAPGQAARRSAGQAVAGRVRPAAGSSHGMQASQQLEAVNPPVHSSAHAGR